MAAIDSWLSSRIAQSSGSYATLRYDKCLDVSLEYINISLYCRCSQFNFMNWLSDHWFPNYFDSSPPYQDQHIFIAYPSTFPRLYPLTQVVMHAYYCYYYFNSCFRPCLSNQEFAHFGKHWTRRDLNNTNLLHLRILNSNFNYVVRIKSTGNRSTIFRSSCRIWRQGTFSCHLWKQTSDACEEFPFGICVLYIVGYAVHRELVDWLLRAWHSVMTRPHSFIDDIGPDSNLLCCYN